MKTVLKFLIVAFVPLQFAVAHFEFQSRIPNGDRVPNPCQLGAIWAGVGHLSPAGANAKNPFGLDFKAAGLQWTVDLCRKDSDGDGLTNGQELGDPDCVWKVGAAPARTTGLSHPGICPLDSATCKNSWTVCPKAFSCPALDGANVTMRNFTLKPTPVPATETTYICQAFELNNTASPVHLIGSRPIIDNKNVMHHMIMYACSVKPEQTLFDNPKQCFMAVGNCTEMLNLWGYGAKGECFNSNAGFRIGGDGFRYGVLQLHWNNPARHSGYTDASGFALYFTQNLRPYDLGTVMYGEGNLVLPPRQPLISVNHTCPSVCTNRYHTETRYITGATIHMHTYGIKGRISLWRNGTMIKDLSPLQVYDYNSPEIHAFDPPIEYRKGDEVKTECYFNTQKTNVTIFFGEGTSDEMCLSFLYYYPNNVSVSTDDKLGRCIGLSGINLCWLPSGITPQVERGCNITAMRNGEIPNRVYSEMAANKCFSRTGCDPLCRNYLENTLWPNNACYDPKRSRQMAELLALGFFQLNSAVTQAISATLFGQRFCEQEIKMLAEMDRPAAPDRTTTTATPPATPSSQKGGLSSEHLLIIIVVCSCLGFILILALLIFLSIKLKGASSAAGLSSGQQGPPDKSSVYKVYDNEARD
ncbi:hypothetical protein BOX15_Mlig027408g1 [Macrostomum lignano]|uniref:DOMON domain-containing protein n=1 Tax=Macrostomum lignano TaxID=282301 RepID=A0A267GFF0_9PLAT|nr:hypothetical protein BOX15_Mlig027408g1 [Macrostomum lignano]